MNCPKCEHKKITTQQVDERGMYRCDQCCHQWYEIRRVSGGYFSVVDEIAESVCEHGEHDSPTWHVINTIWRDGDFHELIQEWCEAHGFTYSFFSRSENGQQEEYVKFRRE